MANNITKPNFDLHMPIQDPARYKLTDSSSIAVQSQAPSANITKPNFGLLSNNTVDQSQGTIQPWTPKPTLKDVKPYEPSGGALVEDRMTGLLEKGSPYLQAAEQRALQTAGKRGLLNTTMAAGAGTAAAIEAALPIASQDAAAFQQAKMAGYQGDINNWLADQKYLRDVDLANQGYASDVGLIGVQESASSRLSEQTAAQAAALSTQEAGQTSVLSSQEAGQVSDLSTQVAGQAADLSAQEAGQTSGLSAQSARQTSALSTQEAAQSVALQQQIDQAATNRTQINADAQKMIAGANLSSGERTNFGNQLIQLSGNASAQVAAIQADPNMTAEAKTAAIKSVNDAYQSYVDSLVSIYGGTVEWVGLGETPTPPSTPSPTLTPANTAGQLTGNYQGTPITADVAEDGRLYMNGQTVGTWSYSGQGNFYNVTFTDGSTATYDYDSGMMYGQGWSLQLDYSPSS